VTLRNETEWVETVEAGWNVLVGSDLDKIVEAVDSFSPPDSHPALYGDGDAAGKCVDLLGVGSEPVGPAERAEYANKQ
jgi:UDP-GlcNAc3NAcA epimerase